MKVQRYRIYQPQPHSFVGLYLLLLDYCSCGFHAIRILLFNQLINSNGYLQIVWLLATTKHNQVWNMSILLVACHMRIYYWYNYSPQSWIIHASFKMITVPLSIFVTYDWYTRLQLKAISVHEPHHSLWCRGHDDVIKWKHFPRYWPFVRGIYRTKPSDVQLWCFRWSATE